MLFWSEVFKDLFTKSVCSGAFGEVMYALACYVLIAVSACVILIDDHSACFGFYSQGVDCHLCSSGNVFKALFASGVFGNDSLQSADVDCEDCIWSCHLWCAIS